METKQYLWGTFDSDSLLHGFSQKSIGELRFILTPDNPKVKLSNGYNGNQCLVSANNFTLS